jgi:hypothetical protein
MRLSIQIAEGGDQRTCLRQGKIYIKIAVKCHLQLY